jgi:chorismate mutase
MQKGIDVQKEKFAAVRGAVQITEDSRKAMEYGVAELLQSIMGENSLTADRMVSIIISQTSDLSACNAASALRSASPLMGSVPLFCVQECETEGMMERVVRFLVHAVCDSDAVVRHVYINGAEKLRPDLVPGRDDG